MRRRIQRMQISVPNAPPMQSPQPSNEYTDRTLPVHGKIRGRGRGLATCICPYNRRISSFLFFLSSSWSSHSSSHSSCSFSHSLNNSFSFSHSLNFFFEFLFFFEILRNSSSSYRQFFVSFFLVKSASYNNNFKK